MASLTSSSSMLTGGVNGNANRKMLVVPHVVTLKSKQSKYIQETIRGPANASLKSLKIWMVKQYPLLPNQFCFVKSGEMIPEAAERTMVMEDLGDQCYIRPYIPEPEKEEEMQQPQQRKQFNAASPQNNFADKSFGSFPPPKVVGSPSASARPKTTPGGKRGGVDAPESTSMYSSFVTGVPAVKPRAVSESSRVRPGSLVEASMSAEKLGVLYGSPTGIYQPSVLSTRLNPNNPEPIWNDPPNKAAARTEW